MSLFILSKFDGLYLVEGVFYKDENSVKRVVLIVSIDKRLSGTLCLNHNEENNRILAGRGKQALEVG